MAENSENIELKRKIAELEARLKDAQDRLSAAPSCDDGKHTQTPPSSSLVNGLPSISIEHLHALLLLADSALPLGSFAYSGGLESFLAHQKSHRPATLTPIASFRRFLKLSIASIASTSLPYVLAGYRRPETLAVLDNDLDASTPCVVAVRASVAQGRALLGVWERAFRESYASESRHRDADQSIDRAIRAIECFTEALKSSDAGIDGLGPKAHLAPLWGVVCLAMGVDVRRTTYVFMLNHAKAVISAAVRASVMGPYQAQGLLASKDLQDMISERIEREWETDTDHAGQSVPTLDLWMGRHELLYSRIFNS